MKNIRKFENFVREDYNAKVLYSSKEELVDTLADMQTVYDLDDLEKMTISQLENLYDEVLSAKAEEHDEEPLSELEYESKKWIKDAIKRPGSLRKKLRKKKGQNITGSEIDAELQALRGKDMDNTKPGLQLSKSNRRKHKQLILAKTLRNL